MAAPAQSILVILATIVAGFTVASNAAAALASFAAMALFCLPGLILFERPFRSAADLALACLVGIAATISSCLILALLVGTLSPANLLVLATPSLAAVGLRFVLRRPALGSATDRCDASWIDVLPPFAALILAAPPLFFAGRIVGDAHVFPAFFNAAFFNADFFKHLAYLQATAQGFPPDNPFDPGRPANYYVGFHLLPAVALAIAERIGTSDPVAVLKAVTLTLAPLLAVSLHAAIRTVGAGTGAAAASTIAALLGPNLKWLVLLPALLAGGALRNIEPDHIGIGAVGSSLLRLLLYVPQHELALAMLCAWLALFLPADARHRPAAAASALLILPAMSISAIIGAWIAVIGIAVTVWPMRDRKLFLMTAAAVALGIGLPLLLGMAASPSGLASEPFLTLPDISTTSLVHRLLADFVMPLTLFGGMGLLAIVQAFLSLRGDGNRTPGRRAAWLLILVMSGFVLFEFLPVARLVVELRLKTSFVAWVLVAACATLAVGQVGAGRPARAFRAACLLLVAIGLGTPLYDLAWHMNAPPEWRTEIAVDEAEALRSIRQGTPPGARIQGPLKPPFLLGGSDMLVPVFAGRKPYAATRSPWLTRERALRINSLFDPTTGAAARLETARALRLGALYIRRAILSETYDALAARLADEGWLRCLNAQSASLWRPPSPSATSLEWTACASPPS